MNASAQWPNYIGGAVGDAVGLAEEEAVGIGPGDDIDDVGIGVAIGLTTAAGLGEPLTVDHEATRTQAATPKAATVPIRIFMKQMFPTSVGANVASIRSPANKPARSSADLRLPGWASRAGRSSDKTLGQLVYQCAGLQYEASG